MVPWRFRSWNTAQAGGGSLKLYGNFPFANSRSEPIYQMKQFEELRNGERIHPKTARRLSWCAHQPRAKAQARADLVGSREPTFSVKGVFPSMTASVQFVGVILTIDDFTEIRQHSLRMTRPFRIPVLLLLLLFLVPATFSGETPWTEARSSHFRVLTNGSNGDARKVLREFEQLRWVFATRFPGSRLESGAPS
jgi:hypothetical protein